MLDDIKLNVFHVARGTYAPTSHVASHDGHEKLMHGSPISMHG